MKSFLLISLIVFASSLLAQKTDSLPPGVYHWENLEAKKEDNRIRRDVMEVSTTSLSYFEVHASTLEPGKAPHPPHTHTDHEELMIIKEGTLKITINGKSKILGPGSIAFAMPGDEHGIENAGNTTATYYILKYKGKLPNIERGKQAGGSFMLDWNDLKTSNTGNIAAGTI
jgi:(S)-ureidoglycine aminohydrolase